MDARLFPLVERAENGNGEAQRQLAIAYLTGKGVPQKDDVMVLCYFLKLAEQDPKDIPEVAYGSLLFSIGNRYFDRRDFQEAIFWYKRSISYIRETYVEDFAEKLIAHLKVENNLKDAVVQSFLSARRPS